MVLELFYTVSDHNLLFLHGKMCLNTVYSSIRVYTCCSIFTCMIHVDSKDATSIVILLAFIDVFCMNVDFYYVSFRHSCTGHMTLPTDVMWQCHHNVGQCRQENSKGISPYHILLNNIYNFNLLGLRFYTPICKGVRLW